MSENTMREAFEASMKNSLKARAGIGAFDVKAGEYTFQVTRMAWESWQAAIAHQNKADMPLGYVMKPCFDDRIWRSTITQSATGSYQVPVYLAPPQPQEVADALEDAAKICDEKVKTIKSNYGVSESIGAEICAREIRALIK